MPFSVGLRPAAWWLAGFAALVLFVAASSQIYQFGSTEAWNLVRTDSARYLVLASGLPRGWPLVLLLLLFIASAFGWGVLPVRRGLPEAAGAEIALLAIAVGLVVLTFAFMALAWVQELRTAPVAALVVAGLLPAALQARRLRSWSPPRPAPTHLLLALPLALTLLLALVAALGPEVQYDARWYHLGEPAHYVLHGGFFPIVAETRIAATGLPPYQEMLYSGLIALGGLIGAKLLHWADAVLACVAIVHFARFHMGSTAAGLLAALLFAGVPTVSWSAATGSNDLPAAFLTVLALHCVLRWRDQPSSRTWLAAAGLLAGYSAGVKPLGLATIALLLLATAWTSRGSDRVLAPLIFGAAAALACVPWWTRAFELTGNPVFPSLNQIFQSPYWNAVADAYVRNTYAIQGGAAKVPFGWLRLPWDVAVNGQLYRSLVGPFFLASLPAAAAALLLGRDAPARLIRLMALLVMAWGALWYLTGLFEIRYLYAVLPLVCLLAAVPLLGPRELRAPPPVRMLLAALAAFALIFNSQPLLPLQRHAADPLEEARASLAWEYLYGGADTRQVVNFPIIFFIDDHLPASAKVYDGCQLVVYYAYGKVEVYNGWNYDGPTTMGEWSLESPDALARLKSNHITDVVICDGMEKTISGPNLAGHLERLPGPPDDRHQLYRVVY
jgi:hypothetical protein